MAARVGIVVSYTFPPAPAGEYPAPLPIGQTATMDAEA